jgi:hypothetical protein
MLQIQLPKMWQNGHSERAIREDRRGGLQYGRREYLPAVPWERAVQVVRRLARLTCGIPRRGVCISTWAGRRLQGEQRKISPGYGDILHDLIRNGATEWNLRFPSQHKDIKMDWEKVTIPDKADKYNR